MGQDEVRAAARALSIEYAIRDVVVPATALEAEGHEIIKLNIGDPIAYPGLPTPQHMVDAYVEAVQRGNNGYSPSYGLPALREAVAEEERSKGWPARSDDIYVCHGVTEALQLLFAAVLEEATLTRPEDGWMASGGKEGRHTEHLGYMIAEMQYLQRTHPGAEW